MIADPAFQPIERAIVRVLAPKHPVVDRKAARIIALHVDHMATANARTGHVLERPPVARKLLDIIDCKAASSDLEPLHALGCGFKLIALDLCEIPALDAYQPGIPFAPG